MRALLLYETIACLVFKRLPLPIVLSGLDACSVACLTCCGMDESLGLHSSHLISSLGWVLLGHGSFLL